MPDLDLQLRTYFEEIAPPHDPEELTVPRVGAGPVRPLGTPLVSRRRRFRGRLGVHQLPHLDEQRRDKKMTDSSIDQPTAGPRRPRVGRGLAIAGAAAIVVIVGVVAFVFVADDGTDVAGGDSRVVQLTFDGEQCIYEGPSVLSAGQGQVEVAFNNESSEESFFWFGRLDEGRTTQDVIDYITDDPSAEPPSWTVGVWALNNIPANSSSTPVMRTVAPGLHNLVCGPASPLHVYFGGELTVTP